MEKLKYSEIEDEIYEFLLKNNGIATYELIKEELGEKVNGSLYSLLKHNYVTYVEISQSYKIEKGGLKRLKKRRYYFILNRITSVILPKILKINRIILKIYKTIQKEIKEHPVIAIVLCGLILYLIKRYVL